MKNKLITLALTSASLLGCSGYTSFSGNKPLAVVGEVTEEKKPCEEVVLKDGGYSLDISGMGDKYFVSENGNLCTFYYGKYPHYAKLMITDEGCNNLIEEVTHFGVYNKSVFDRDFLEQEGYVVVFDNLARTGQSFVCEEYRMPTKEEQEVIWKKNRLKEIVDKLE